MGLATRRHHRARVIVKRVKIARHIWKVEGNRYYIPGRFSKWNLCCSCGMCREPKYRETRHLPAQ